MKKIAFLSVATFLALAGSLVSTKSAEKVAADEEVGSHVFTFVERLGSSTHTIDEANQSISFLGGWDSKFLVADGVDLTNSKKTFSMHVQGTNGDGNDLQNGFGIYLNDTNYMMAYLRWSNAGTIDGLHYHGHINGQWASSWSAVKDQWGEDWGVVPEWCDMWSDFSGWTTDSDTPDGAAGNFNNFRAQSAITLASGFDMGITYERTTYKGRDADRVQVFVTAIGKDSQPHTWYTPSIMMDAFTNPNGGADSAVKNQRPMLGIYNCNVSAVTYSNFKEDGKTIRMRDPNNTTGAVTFRSKNGIPAVREVRENNQTIKYQGGWDGTFLLADGLPTTHERFSFSTDIKGTFHDGGDNILGFTLYHDEINYIMMYFRWSNCGTIDGLHMLAHVNGQWDGVYGYARDPWDDWQSPGTFADCWSDFSGWITDSEIADGAAGNFNNFRAETSVFIDTGFTAGITCERGSWKGRTADKVQLSVTALGNDSQIHTWYTPIVYIDAFTCPKGGAVSPLVDEAPKVALLNNSVGVVEYSNIKFNGQPVNVKKPNYYTVSFDVDGIEDQVIEEGLKATKPADPTDPGAIFDKWTVNGEEFDFNTPITSNLNVVSTWFDDRAVLTFDSAGGSAVAEQKIIKGECAVEPADPTRQWHTFDGWYTDEGDLFDFDTPVTDSLTLHAHWTETEIKTNNNVLLNKFVPAKGQPAVLNAASDNQSLNFQGGWDGNFIVTDQFDTTKDRWELSAHLSGEVGDGNDTMFGFVLYYNDANYAMIYLRWSNVGTIDGMHMIVHSGGNVDGVYQSSRDCWGETFATRSTFFDNWSDYGVWTTNQREPLGDGEESNWNKMRAQSALLLDTGFDVKLYVENTKFAGRDVQKIQIGVSDLDLNGVQSTWYTSMVAFDAFTNPFGGADSAFKNVAPKVGFANNKVGTVNISKISFKETATHTVTFVDGNKKTEVEVVDGYRVARPANPAMKPGKIFTGWEKDGQAFNFNTPIYGDITITANFGRGYSVYVSTYEHGTLTVDKNLVLDGETVTINAAASEGYVLKRVMVNGEAIEPVDNEYKFVVHKDVVITAKFEKVLAVSVGTVANGSVTVDKRSGTKGDLVTVTATANEGYELGQVMVNGKAIQAVEGVYTFTMTADSEVTATFTQIPVETKGCGGSVVIASSLVSLLAVAGLGLVINKRKED